MHLLRTQPGGFVPDDSIADLGQTPAELVILCSGDSHLALLADTAEQLPQDYPSLRLANPMQVQNHASVDLYVDQVLRHAKVILVSLHGGDMRVRSELGKGTAISIHLPLDCETTAAPRRKAGAPTPLVQPRKQNEEIEGLKARTH